MKLTTYLNSEIELETLNSLGGEEAIISPLLISRFGTLELDDSMDLAKKCRVKGIMPICEWDILPTDKEFKTITGQLPTNFFDHFDEIRVQDTGVLNFLLRETKHPIQWIAETAHHNLHALKAMEKYIGKRLSRLILSLELPLDKIGTFTKELQTPTEILGLGRILLFYTPRKLVSPLMDQNKKVDRIEITANSEESPHRGFPVMQNAHGTFMFNPKDHCLLEYGDKLLNLGLSHLRIDLRHDFDFLLFSAIHQGFSVLQEEENGDLNWVREVKENCPRPLIRGFASVNKTDHQFIKLKNHRIARTDKNYVGQVLDVKKGSYIAIKVKDNMDKVKLGTSLQLRTPEGKLKDVKLTKLKSSNGENTQNVSGEEIVFINHVGGVSVRTAVYLSHSKQN